MSLAFPRTQSEVRHALWRERTSWNFCIAPRLRYRVRSTGRRTGALAPWRCRLICTYALDIHYRLDASGDQQSKSLGGYLREVSCKVHES